MIESAGQGSTIHCRRCGQVYELPRATTLLTSCPHCGAAPVPLWRRLGRHNGISAILCVLALIVLPVAVVMPFISMSKLGEVRVFSLIGGVLELFDRGNWFIGTVLFVFSIIFPAAKLVALLAATSSLARLSQSRRRLLHKLAMLTGKYSLLDILVVAIMIVLVKFDGIAEVRSRPGTVLFCVAILLSILAGVFVDLEEAVPAVSRVEPTVAPSPDEVSL